MLGMHQQLSFLQDASGENAELRNCFPRDPPAMLARLLQGHGPIFPELLLPSVLIPGRRERLCRLCA